jgi:hypothetical protein
MLWDAEDPALRTFNEHAAALLSTVPDSQSRRGMFTRGVMIPIRSMV